MVSDFNVAGQGLQCYIEAKYFKIKDIYELYYGKNYKENIIRKILILRIH